MSPIFGLDICHLFGIGIFGSQFFSPKNDKTPNNRWQCHVGDATSPTFNVNSALTRLSKFPVLHFWILFWFIQTIISLWYHQFCCKYCVRWKINLFPSSFFHFFLRGRWLHNDLVKLQGYVTGEEVDAGESFQESQRHFLGNALTQTSHFILFTSSVFLNRLYMAVDNIRWS